MSRELGRSQALGTPDIQQHANDCTIRETRDARRQRSIPRLSVDVNSHRMDDTSTNLYSAILCDLLPLVVYNFRVARQAHEFRRSSLEIHDLQSQDVHDIFLGDRKPPALYIATIYRANY